MKGLKNATYVKCVWVYICFRFTLLRYHDRGVSTTFYVLRVGGCYREMTNVTCCWAQGLTRFVLSSYLGATSIDKIGEVWLSDEIGEGGLKFWKKTNFTITIRYKKLPFLSVGPFIEDRVGVYKISARSWNFKDYFNWGAPLLHCHEVNSCN